MKRLDQTAASALVKALSGVARCPDTTCQFQDQELFQRGDDPTELYCPHCELEFRIEVSAYFEVPVIKEPIIDRITILDDGTLEKPTMINGGDQVSVEFDLDNAGNYRPMIARIRRSVRPSPEPTYTLYEVHTRQ